MSAYTYTHTQLLPARTCLSANTDSYLAEVARGGRGVSVEDVQKEVRGFSQHVVGLHSIVGRGEDGVRGERDDKRRRER